MLKKIAIVVVVTLSVPVCAAIFTIENKSSQTVHLNAICSAAVCLSRDCSQQICGKQNKDGTYDEIASGQSIRYDTGADDIVRFEWMVKSGQKRTMYTAKVDVWGGNLGGSFTIHDDGKYDYYFGVNGFKNDEIAKKYEFFSTKN